MKTRIFLPIIMAFFFLTGCYVTSYTQYDPIYEDRTHSTDVYWWNDSELGGSPYWGYWSGYYYYYGIPHYYPWWYYYQFMPPHHYAITTHIVIHIQKGNYVYGHRGNKFHNIGPSCPTNGGKYTPDVKEISSTNNKPRVFPISWKNNNSSINTKQNDRNFNLNNQNFRPVDNRIYVKPNKNNNRNTNTIKNNHTKPTRPNNKVNINRKRP